MKVEDLGLWNPWWEDEKAFARYYNYSFLAFRELELPKHTILRGPRQVGKTVFLKRTLSKELDNADVQKLVYISADRLGGVDELRRLVRDLVGLAKTIVIDEAPSLTHWEKAVKEAFELEFEKVWVSGSRPVTLERAAEFFPGRANVINFYPLSFREYVLSFIESLLVSRVKFGSVYYDRQREWEKLNEFCRGLGLSVKVAEKLREEIRDVKLDRLNPESLAKAKKLIPYGGILNRLFDLYLETGGYPSAVEARILGNELPFNLVLQDILGTIEKEGLSLERLNQILPSIAKGMGVSMELRSLAPQLGASTLYRYITTLERSFLLRRLYFFDGQAHPKKGMKFYFTDPFIVRAITEYYGIKGPDIGQIVESVVIEAMVRRLEDPFVRSASHMMGYGKLRGKEVDVVTKSIKIEVKYRTKPIARSVDVILTKEEFSLGEPVKIPVSFFLVML